MRTGSLVENWEDLSIQLQMGYPQAKAHVQESAVIVDWKDCPLVEVITGKVSVIPLLKGTRMPADAILENYTSGCRQMKSRKSFNFLLPKYAIHL